ncbi:MAG: glutaredoxin family protein [Pseudomonadota bacterium]|nr:glutaredoxin family protein [Pseudomonadota bacterium]
MKSITAVLGTLIVLASAGASAQQMYKWVGADGKVTYSDTPPPASAKRSETKAIGNSGAVATELLPYELAQAVRTSPVTLYTTGTCPACDTGRSYLSKRGIPFAEKTVSTAEDAERLKQAGSNGTLPLLVVGRAKRTGFETGAWGAMLSAAGYPETSKLPSTYRNPQAAAAAPITIKESGDKPATETADSDSQNKPAPERPANGFRF